MVENNFNLQRGNKGFSLAEIMVSMGLMGVVALGTMQLTKNSMQSQKRFEASSEGQALFHSLNQQLLDSEACINTLQTMATVSDGTQITAIRNRKNRVVFDTKRNANKAIKIDSITVANLIGSHADGFSEFDLVVKLERTSNQFSDNTKFVEYKIPIQAEIKNGRVTRCYAHTDNAVASAKREVCENIGGTYNLGNNLCDLSNDITKVSQNVAASIKLVEENYVKMKGDIMTGDLKVKGAKICIDGNCRDFTPQDCGPGMLIEKINSDGTLVCRNVTCPSTKFFNGIDRDGNTVCKSLPTETCPTNQFIKEVRTDGTIVCEDLPFNWGISCLPGQYIEKISVGGVAVCKDIHTLAQNLNCGQDQFISKAPNGNLICITPTPAPTPIPLLAPIPKIAATPEPTPDPTATPCSTTTVSCVHSTGNLGGLGAGRKVSTAFHRINSNCQSELKIEYSHKRNYCCHRDGFNRNYKTNWIVGNKVTLKQTNYSAQIENNKLILRDGRGQMLCQKNLP